MDTVQTIVLIDDDFISNFITERLILRENFAQQVLKFTSGEEALLFFTQEAGIENNTRHTGIILLDLNMPTMNGWEFIEAYEKLPAAYISNWLLYMLSSAVDAKDIVHAKTINLVEDFISKPLTKEDIDIIREAHLNNEPPVFS